MLHASPDITTRGPRRVLVFNQYALPRDQAGGTRHIDLFGRLQHWDPLILAGNRNYGTQQPFTTDDARFRLIRVSSSDGSLRSRLVTWIEYCLGSLAAGLRTSHIDAVVASSPQMFVPLVGWIVARIKRVPFVVEIRDLWPESLVAAGAIAAGSAPHRLLQALEHWYYARADAIITVTQGWTSYFESLGCSAKISMIPNGADAAPPPCPGGRQAAREKRGITGFTAIFAGSHGPKDGLNHVLSAAAACPGYHFLFVGAGPERETLISKAAETGLHNVTFLDPVAKEDLVELLQACDAGIHAVTPLSVFRHGMSPNKLFDYLAAGLPVASNAGEAVSDIMPQGSCGFYGAPESLPTLLQRIAEAPEEVRTTWSNNARAIMEGNYSRNASARKLNAALEAVIARKRIRTSYVPTWQRQKCG